MPIIDVTLVEGRSPEQVRALIHELFNAARKALDAPASSIRIAIREVKPAHFAVGDTTKEESAAAAETGSVQQG